MTEKSLKTQAEDIMVAVERDLQQIDPAKAPDTLAEVDTRANALMNTLFNVVSDVDLEAAVERVRQLKVKYPDASPQELSQMLIREKGQKTATVGAVTSGAALIPGLGTAAALTLGVAADRYLPGKRHVPKVTGIAKDPGLKPGVFCLWLIGIGEVIG